MNATMTDGFRVMLWENEIAFPYPEEEIATRNRRSENDSMDDIISWHAKNSY